MTTLGFTGTREGLTEKQYLALRSEISRRNLSPAAIFRHGDCIGADSDAHDVVRTCSHARIFGHPPIKSALRAYRKCDHLMPERPYLDRNRDIVNMSDELIACPNGPERQRSGTWSTVRYACGVGKKVTIIMPDGSLTAGSYRC